MNEHQNAPDAVEVPIVGQELTDPVKFAENAHRVGCKPNHAEGDCVAIILAMHLRDLMPRIARLEARYDSMLARVPDDGA